MTVTLHPLRATGLIRDSYLRYLKTIYPFQDPELREHFWRALDTPDLLVKGPLLEASPPFKAGRSIADLVQAGTLHPLFRTLCSAWLPLTRPLYVHQERGIEKVIRGDRNVIVASGTGSGKTETFMIPILDHLLREHEAGTLQGPGVRALLLYPMNALANDQLKRLRRVLSGFPAITFGRYTGETREEQGEAERAFRDQFPREPRLRNELISRVQMRAAPPHLLLTNYAMLEYLLLRPEDCVFFDGETGHNWRFLVLDEAHVYDGASGIEMAMLMRRLKDRVTGSEPGRLRCIATSATLGRGQEDYPAVTQFASNLFAEPFEWVEDDPTRQDVVAGVRAPMATLGTSWGEAPPGLYAALQRALPTDEEAGPDAVGHLADIARQLGAPEAAVHLALEQAQGLRADTALERFLYILLRGDVRLRVLLDNLSEAPRFLSELAAELFATREDAAERLIDLVSLAVRARPDPDSSSLLPARYHVFARALEGAFICLNASARAHSDGAPRLFLRRVENCPHCGARVVEAATCTRCGAAYAVGRIEEDPAGSGRAILRQLTAQFEGQERGVAYFSLAGRPAEPDEDEAVASGEEIEGAEEPEESTYTLCLRCGAIGLTESGGPGCECSVEAPRETLSPVDLQGKLELRRCVACGARGPGIVYRFLTGQDGPASVLATALYQSLPPSPDDDAQHLPGQGRKLLAFSDSRQDAAFFAPYLQRTYEQVLRRRLILKTLSEDPDGVSGRLRLRDVIGRLLDQAEMAVLFTQDMSFDERRRLVSTWLMQEMVAWDRRMSLEGLGLVHFRLVQPQGWRPPQPLLQGPWRLTPGEAWQLIALLLETLRAQGAVKFLEGVDPRDEAFAPRNRALYMRLEGADPKNGVFGWAPARGNNRRLDLLVRLLARGADLSDDERRRVGMDVLRSIWSDYLTTPQWEQHLPGENLPRGVGFVHRLSPNFWEAVPVPANMEGAYQCSKCRAVSYTNLRGVCPTYRCDGNLVAIDPDEPAWAENHYRHLYRTLSPIPLSAEEHTAQWAVEAASKVQQRFVGGQLNALSCSTTFELGVDVGELQAVLMRNVPPTTANYVQRAGRAGRRTDSAAFALTYAQRRSHDLTHYTHPERMVTGHIRSPVVVVANEKIVRRHVHSVLFAAFFRWALQQRQRQFRNVGTFFEADPPAMSGPELLREYVDAHPASLREALERITPIELQHELGIVDWGWLPSLCNERNTGLLDKVTAEVTGDLTELRRLEDEAAAQRRHMDSLHFERVARTVRTRELLGFLGSRNVLPKYGFPTDLVELRTNHLNAEHAVDVELQRDLRIAISEYAPGGEVVAAKQIWVSGGLIRPPNRDWQTYHYAVCPDCGRFHRSIAAIEGPCNCGGDLRRWSRLRGVFLVPEFGFIVRDAPRQSGEARPQRIHSSQVFFAEYATPANADMPAEPQWEMVPTISSGRIQVWQRYSRYGKLALVNPGLDGRGFCICQACGFAEPAPPEARRQRRGSTRHTNPRTGQSCGGTLETYHLGHEFITDVAELRFDGLLASTASYELWRSLLYALLEGASMALSIRRDDLDGTLYHYAPGLPPALVLYDNVPGGAGHVSRIGRELPDVCRAALDRVRDCECGAETSCYECLRNYRNQFFHDQLRRGLARDFLGQLLGPQ